MKVDYDEEQRLGERGGVLSIPTIVFVENGEPVAQTIAALPKRVLEQKLGLAA